jgi:hypothetical protein
MEDAMTGVWRAEPAADFLRRLGKSSHELGTTSGNVSCPDIWELANGDIAVIGTELSAAYYERLPAGVSIDPGESLVVIPRKMIIAAKSDIPDE